MRSSATDASAPLAASFRVIAIDLPGFGDSDKPVGAAYDPSFFARAVVDLLDALDVERAHVVGNSLGGRVALERRSPRARARSAPGAARAVAGVAAEPSVGPAAPARASGAGPRPARAAIGRRAYRPWADSRRADGWTAAGVDEFLRAYLTPAGRAAFYAAARHIYLEEPHGDDGFWTRLRTLHPEALFVWGRRDRLVPLGFARHVAEALPDARHVELDCGHVPQVELARQDPRGGLPLPDRLNRVRLRLSRGSGTCGRRRARRARPASAR